jgi:two-component system, OmpR family, phosphate regulon sensor histidine kinase PhoR
MTAPDAADEARERRDDRARQFARTARFDRVAGPRLVVLAITAVLLIFVATDVLSLTHAAIAVAVAAAAGMVGEAARHRSPAVAPAQRGSAAVLSSESINAMLVGLPDPVVALDRDGIVLAFNAPASALAPALRAGEPASFALRMPEILAAIRRAGGGGGPQRAEFSERVPVDRWYEVYVTGLRLDGARTGVAPDLVLMTFHDLTPLRRVEEMRADFVANASHELRTPLATLSGFIETLQGPARDDAAARERFLAIMKQQAFRMARLIDDLLSLSRIELNAHVRPETPVDLAAIVRQVTDAMQMLARERGVEVTVTAPAEPVVVAGDRDELVRVFENLVENALKYGAAGKRVEIAIARETGADGAPEAVVSVRDFGPGIAPEHLPRLTERFYRVDVAQSRAEGGTGLGLAIVKHILARHHGRLAVDSTLGQGATFAARLPLAPA